MRYLIIIIMFFSFITKANTKSNINVYSHSFEKLDGNLLKFEDYKDKVIVVVNVASRCGFTYQYEGLQKLWEEYQNENVVVVGVPTNNFKQEPGNNEDIKNFCETNFGINFPMTQKTNVIGSEAHPFYKWAKNNYGLKAVPKWNFHKIIINKKGHISDTFASITRPSSPKFIKAIEKEIKN